MATQVDFKNWTMPEWMEKYRPLISNTGGNTVEDLIDRLNNAKGLFQTNHIVYVMASDVQGQVCMLYRLKQEGLLNV